MTARAPLADVQAEARQVLAGCAEHKVSARLIGGLAVAMHQHLPTPQELQRSYADIDIVIGRKDGKGAKAGLLELGYVPNDRFNALRGDRRLLFYDTVNGRQLDVFVGTFAMCHTLDLSARLSLLPDTLSVADLVLTKLQIVEINTKDLVDAAQLLRNHELGRGDAAGQDEVSLDRLCAVTSADWGWYTTLSDNLAKLAAFAHDALPEPDRTVVTERAQAIQRAIDEPSKSLRWKARARIGRHSPWYELPEEVAGTGHG
ncbi:MAG TPA: hypothetical protein VIX15_12620 [Streptosporangiaceae bacterium]